MADKRRPGLAVVTGASTGIGFALADELAHRGFDLIVAADEDRILDAAKQLGEAGVMARPVRADLATPAGVDQLYDEITAQDGPVEVLAINAGVGVSGDFARHNALDAELRLIDLNVRSAVQLAKLVVEPMARRGRGRVLFTSSIAASAPGPYHATYAASKAFLLSFAQAIRYELRDTGVTVTALMPGVTDTEFFDRARMNDTPVARADKDDPALVARQAVAALFDGRASVVTGSWRNRAQVYLGRLAPDGFKARIQGRLTRPDPGR